MLDALGKGFIHAFMRNPPLDYISTKIKWWEIFNQGLERHRRALREARSPPQKDTVRPLEKLPRDPYDYRGLWDDQMMMSIGVVWDALRQNDILFAVADHMTLKLCRGKTNTGIVNPNSTLGPNTFIIPLDFGADRVGQTGHHLLAVAQVNERGSTKVRLMDSSPGRIAKQHIQAAIAGVVMYSGWLGKDGEGPLMVWPAIEFTDVCVPEQELVNACGLNVILNAWAEILNISINNQRYRVKPCEDQYEEAEESADFLRQTIEIINLTMLGHMDTETILAFMISYGYAGFEVPLNPKDRSDANFVPQLELAPLTTTIDDLIHRVNNAISLDDSYKLNEPNQDDLHVLMNQAKCTKQAAGKALEYSKGDMRIARWFIPVPWNDAQKVKALIRSTKCSAEEAKEGLHQASGNSRVAQPWVKAARKRTGRTIETRNRADTTGRGKTDTTGSCLVAT